MLAVVLLLSASVYAAEITVAAGAGFKKMVTDIAVTCEKDFGVKMNMSFGNLGQMIAQIKTTGLIDAVIGDSKFFKKSGIEFADKSLIGNGRLVLAWRKGIVLDSVKDIMTDKVQKIAIPDFKKAIYGIAGTEFLASSGMSDAAKDKLIQVATVPQVTSYLVTGEVDAGFSNLTDIQASADKVGGYIVIDEGYERIDIISGIIAGHDGTEAAALYKKCIASDAVKAIAKKHGL